MPCTETTPRTRPFGRDGRDDARAEAVKTGTLDALAEMRGAGMNFIRRLDKRAAGLMDETELAGMARVGDDCVAFERMARAVRQIIVLEQENRRHSADAATGDRRRFFRQAAGW